MGCAVPRFETAESLRLIGSVARGEEEGVVACDRAGDGRFVLRVDVDSDGLRLPGNRAHEDEIRPTRIEPEDRRPHVDGDAIERSITSRARFRRTVAAPELPYAEPNEIPAESGLGSDDTTPFQRLLKLVLRADLAGSDHIEDRLAAVLGIRFLEHAA